ncbi:MAG: hypothetical protein K5829_05080 [Treponema sp.]|nr:hypothetical protein [Treponema sp.]
MKKSILLLAASLFAAALFAQSDDELFGGSSDFVSDDELFGGTLSDDELFGGESDFSSDEELFGGDDDLFTDDGIDIIQDTSAKSSLSKGVLFDNGSIKIGGNFSTGISTTTSLYADDDKSFGDHIKESILSPSLSAYLTLDARPTENLRMYTKFGLAYPFTLNASSTASTSASSFTNPWTSEETTTYTTNVSTSVTDWFSLKELFTDFSIKDRVFFRFGYHTVTWGTGYFFSPVSEMINTSLINPENTSEQVNGSLNLRTQITFPDSQNCLWLYLIPSTDFINSASASSYVRDTALAGKFDLLIGTWELGLGAYWKYQNSPRAMLTASGSFKNFSLFGEFVYRYGSDSEWGAKADSWEDKTSIFQVTAGVSRYWKNQNILMAAQYYYNSYDVDGDYYLKKLINGSLNLSDFRAMSNYVTNGHNLAAMINFGRLFGTKDLTAAIFALVNFEEKESTDLMLSVLKSYGVASSLFNSMTISGLLYYSPITDIKFGLGPYITFSDFESAPNVALKIDFTLGGGKF